MEYVQVMGVTTMCQEPGRLPRKLARQEFSSPHSPSTSSPLQSSRARARVFDGLRSSHGMEAGTMLRGECDPNHGMPGEVGRHLAARVGGIFFFSHATREARVRTTAVQRLIQMRDISCAIDGKMTESNR